MTINNVRLYGFCGRKRSGKGVLSNIIKEKYNGVIVTAANYLKFICCDILCCTLEELNKKKDDGTVFSLKPDERWFDIINNKTGINIEDIKRDISDIEFTSIRQILQVIGTDCIRKHKPNWHVDCMKKDIEKYLSEGKTIAVDDVRFPNEREAIERLGGVCFFIVRPMNTEISNHISETSLTWDMFDYDHIIINDESLERLKINFEWHLDNEINGLANIAHCLFYSEMSHLQKVNLSFGKEHTDVIDDILAQNNGFSTFMKNGVIFYRPTSKELVEQFVTESGVTDYYHDQIYLLYNPLVNENFKVYL